MKDELNNCKLCPKNCEVNRNNGNVGFCKIGNKIKVALAYLHMWEEPCLSGDAGSGTIFFSGCNLACIYCQNYKISNNQKGEEITIRQFSDMCLDLERKKANNINLVTPTAYVPLIIEGLTLAKANGLNIPIVYNTSSYENVDTIKMLNGLVDIYLPDLKYYEDDIAFKYSKCNDYFKYVKDAIDEMYKQVGKPVFDDNGIMKKGIIIRHLVLPDELENSKKILKYLYDKYQNNIYYSIMSQYTPVKKLKYENLNRKLTKEEYDEIINYAIDLGIENAYIQDLDAALESFIPNF